MTLFWNNIRYFKAHEFYCKCGECVEEEHMDSNFITLLDEMRHKAGRGFTINSGWRCRNHPEEKKKDKPGAHNQGTAVDIKVSGGSERFEIIQLGLAVGMVGIGVANSFVHVDSGHKTSPRPMAWKY